jgi:hypothetical protein
VAPGSVDTLRARRVPNGKYARKHPAPLSDERLGDLLIRRRGRESRPTLDERPVPRSCALAHPDSSPTLDVAVSRRDTDPIQAQLRSEIEGLAPIETDALVSDWADPRTRLLKAVPPRPERKALIVQTSSNVLKLWIDGNAEAGRGSVPRVVASPARMLR